MPNIIGQPIPNPPSAATATVVVDETLTPDDYNSKFIAPDSGVWVDYLIKNRYEKDLGLVMMGITSPMPFQGSSVAFAQLKSPTLFWVCEWTAAKSFEAPEVPSPNSNDPNWILVGEQIEPGMVTLSPDGVTPIYRLSGTYIYGHINPSADIAKNISFARPPWLANEFSFTVSDADFETGLINLKS